MSIQYEFEHDIADVFRLFTDPDFIVDRCLDLGELEASCEVRHGEDSAIVTMTRKLERDLPGFLARMMEPTQTIRITERWESDGEDCWEGEYSFVVEGQPVTIGAKFELYATDSGCCYLIDHKATAKIPLVGRKIEKYVLAQAGEGCKAELEYMNEHLG